MRDILLGSFVMPKLPKAPSSSAKHQRLSGSVGSASGCKPVCDATLAVKAPASSAKHQRLTSSVRSASGCKPVCDAALSVKAPASSAEQRGLSDPVGIAPGCKPVCDAAFIAGLRPRPQSIRAYQALSELPPAQPVRQAAFCPACPPCGDTPWGFCRFCP